MKKTIVKSVAERVCWGASVFVFLMFMGGITNGCAALSSITSEWYDKLYGNKPSTNKPPTMVTNPPPVIGEANLPAGWCPASFDHGTPFEVTVQAASGDRDSWMQYPDGYFKSGFLTMFDGWAVVAAGKALSEHGGRDCSGSKILGVYCKVATSFDPGVDGKGNVWSAPQAIPDKVDWFVYLEGGFVAKWSYSHRGDVLSGPPGPGKWRIEDVATKATWDFDANGYGGPGNHRMPYTYEDSKGKKWVCSVRYNPKDLVDPVPEDIRGPYRPITVEE